MVLGGKQKAALLLMTLDAGTAAELLKGVDPETVQELAVEVAYLDASGDNYSVQTQEIVRQFCNSLGNTCGGFDIQEFLGIMLKSSVGREKAERIQTQIDGLLQKRDPFLPIRQADSKKLAGLLSRMHPQAASVVLSELSPRKSSEIIGLLDGPVRLQIVTRMTGGDIASPGAKARIAEMLCAKLETKSSKPDAPEQDQTPRKIALMLRNLSKEIRDGLLDSIKKHDSNTGKMIADMLLLWEDISEITDRSLQTALREIDLQKLALALINADPVVTGKIKANMSERAAETLEEETSLMASPSKADIQAARDEVVGVLRKMNDRGDLNFNEE